MMNHELEEGSKRIKTFNLKQYIKENNEWILSEDMSTETKIAIEKYLKTKNLNYLIDKHISEFLKGHMNSQGHPSGQRVKILPNGKKIARGGFSIFAKNLKFNDKKKTAWAVQYENTSGLKTYLYDEENIHLEQKKKTQIVNKFIKAYPLILKKIESDIQTKNDLKYLTLYTLLKTLIRVGNLEYYLHYGHKGLTTLQKKNININNNIVKFSFIGKDGVPQEIKKEFPKFYINKLSKILNNKKNDDFIFISSNNLPIHSANLSKILFKYTGEHFYPHIIRSFYADYEIRKFIKKNKIATKKEVIDKFKEIALALGHKKFNKKKNKWIVDYNVTINNYIRPEYVEKMKQYYK